MFQNQVADWNADDVVLSPAPAAAPAPAPAPAPAAGGAPAPAARGGIFSVLRTIGIQVAVAWFGKCFANIVLIHPLSCCPSISDQIVFFSMRNLTTAL
jgi:hypothetical protein